MRIRLLSDTHTEFDRDGGKAFIDSLDPTRTDVLILAGDVSNSHGLWLTLMHLCQRFSASKVLYTAGNHEYYGDDPEHVHGDIRDLEEELPNLTWLDKKVVDIEGVRFAGCTLWFRDDPMNQLYERQLADFSHIQDFKPWVYEENRRCEAFLREAMSAERVPDVVVTHHLPSWSCVVPKWRGSDLNRFFVSPIAETLPVLPKVWAYGHGHDANRFSLGDCEFRTNCEFVTNPRGYPSEYRNGFDPNLTFEVQSSEPKV